VDPVVPTYSVVGLAIDDGSTFCPALVLHGDVRRLLADSDRPQPGAVLYVVKKARNTGEATHRALEHFEAGAAQGHTVWEQGEVYFL
jgi:hypothetical protein